MMNVSFSASKASAQSPAPIIVLVNKGVLGDDLAASSANTNLSATMPVRQSGEGRLNRLA